MPLPDEIEARGGVMVPRVWLVETTDGLPRFPRTITVNVDGADRQVMLWTDRARVDVGPFPALEFRHDRFPNRLFVLVKVADITLAGGATGALVICWTAARTREQVQQWLEAIEGSIPELRRAWRCNVAAADGLWAVAALDADGTAAGTLAKNNWPTGWRRWRAADLTGWTLTEPGIASGPYPAPTGARVLGLVLS